MTAAAAELFCTDFLLGMGGLGKGALIIQKDGAGPGSPSGALSPTWTASFLLFCSYKDHLLVLALAQAGA